MSSSGSWPVLIIEPGTSRWLAALLVLAHALALISIVVTGLPAWVSVSGCVLLAANLAHTIRRHVLRKGRSGLRGARWNPDGSWAVWGGDGQVRDAALVPGSVVTRQFSVLNFRGPGMRTDALVLVRDAVDAETMRRLVTRFRLDGGRAG